MNTLRPRITPRVLCTCSASIYQKLQSANSNVGVKWLLQFNVLRRKPTCLNPPHPFLDGRRKKTEVTKRIILGFIFPESHDVGELGIDPEHFEVAGEAALSALLRSFIFFFLLPHGFSNFSTSFCRQQSADMGFCDIFHH